MSNFLPIDRQTGFLLPPSVDEWLPEKHLARFVVEVIDGLDCTWSKSPGLGCDGLTRGAPANGLNVICSGHAEPAPDRP